METAIGTEPQRTLTYANLGMLQIAKGNQPAAEAAFKRAVEVDPRSEAAHLSLANYYWAAHQWAEVERELKIALDIEPEVSEQLTERFRSFTCTPTDRLRPNNI